MRGPQQFFRERVAAGGAGEGADKGAELGQTVVDAGRRGGAVPYAVDVDLAGAGGLAGLAPEAGGESGDRATLRGVIAAPLRTSGRSTS
ncbi:hypothetical protein AB0D38_02355 [Streptomyces sp. NPDC048279]|uniref:hypothetical protein n=1 Tax=Streptomyces sp. NPDC048279 TaxID=3154714 RepID=UPI0034458F73